jgi:hypothetical protein
MTSVELLPLIRELFSRYPEYRYRAAWELQRVLFSLGYVEDPEDEEEVATAAEVARTDVTGEAA